MKLVLSLVLLTAIGNQALANDTTPVTVAQSVEEKYNECTKKCSLTDCMEAIKDSYSSNIQDKNVYHFVCIEVYKNCLAKCLFDYKQAMKQSNNAAQSVQQTQK